jgi:hypothetical protein
VLTSRLDETREQPDDDTRDDEPDHLKPLPSAIAARLQDCRRVSRLRLMSVTVRYQRETSRDVLPGCAT